MIELTNIKYFTWNHNRELANSTYSIFKELNTTFYSRLERDLETTHKILKPGDLFVYERARYITLGFEVNGDVMCGFVSGGFKRRQKYLIFLYRIEDEGIIFFDGRNYGYLSL